MRIVGIGAGQQETFEVHTIDVWFSERRAVWVVERLDADGNQIGLSDAFQQEEQAALCVEEWTRTHQDVMLVAGPLSSLRDRRKRTGGPQRSAA